MSEGELFLGLGNDSDVHLLLRYGNRHGLIAGATGTGKTVTLQCLAEGLSDAGVPVFMADVKGDLSGMCQAASASPPLLERANKLQMTDFAARAFPVLFWDLFGKQGHPIRTTISEMGPLLLSRLLELNDTQEGVINIVFKLADDEGLLLLDLKDLRAMLQWVGDNAKEIQKSHGNVSSASIGAIQRRLLVLENQGAEHFFGEPALDIQELVRTDRQGRGLINILAADELIESPHLYATLLLWLLSELFEELPEVGDLDRPRLVFFFDEAHLLFTDAPKALVKKVEQVVRLIRSKGVGVFFVTQNPTDVPDTVLAQLGNRIQHALRAYTPKEQEAIRAAADSFRANPGLDTQTVITELGVGEALVSVLQNKGVPSVVQRTLIRPPQSRIGPATDAERQQVIKQSPLFGRFDNAIDRESAFEVLRSRAAEAEAAAKQDEDRRDANERSQPRRSGRGRQTLGEAFTKTLTRTLATGLGRQILRGVLGSIFKGR